MKKQKITMINENATITVKDAFERFKRSKVADNISPKTLKTYETHYQCFALFYDSSKPIASISEETIEDYKEYLQKTGTKNSQTIQSYIGSLRAFLYYCMKKEMLNNFEIRKPRGEKKEKEPYDEEELFRLLQKPVTNRFVEYRTWVYINFVYGTGCRINTALNVKIRDIDFIEHEVRFKVTKSKSDARVPLSSNLEVIIKEYLVIRKGEPDEYLFCLVDGEHMSNKTMQDALKRYNNGRGVIKSSSHLFRHAFARDWLRYNNNPYILQTLMQHKSITTTRGYVHQYSRDLHEAYSNNNPLDDIYKAMAGTKNPKNKERINMGA